MRVVIMGCGRVGILLTQELVAAGHQVAVIDRDARAFDRLPPGFEAKRVVGLGFDRGVLEEAGIREADAFLGEREQGIALCAAHPAARMLPEEEHDEAEDEAEADGEGEGYDGHGGKDVSWPRAPWPERGPARGAEKPGDVGARGGGEVISPSASWSGSWRNR